MAKKYPKTCNGNGYPFIVSLLQLNQFNRKSRPLLPFAIWSIPFQAFRRESMGTRLPLKSRAGNHTFFQRVRLDKLIHNKSTECQHIKCVFHSVNTHLYMLVLLFALFVAHTFYIWTSPQNDVERINERQLIFDLCYRWTPHSLCRIVKNVTYFFNATCIKLVLHFIQLSLSL